MDRNEGVVLDGGPCKKWRSMYDAVQLRARRSWQTATQDGGRWIDDVGKWVWIMWVRDVHNQRISVSLSLPYVSVLCTHIHTSRYIHTSIYIYIPTYIHRVPRQILIGCGDGGGEGDERSVLDYSIGTCIIIPYGWYMGWCLFIKIQTIRTAKA